MAVFFRQLSLTVISLSFYRCDDDVCKTCWCLLCMMQVLIVGHVPPGVFGRVGYVSWMRPTFNKRFVHLLQQYHSIIVAAVFGHEHTDAFHVVYNDG